MKNPSLSTKDESTPKTIIYIGDFKESYATENYIAHGLKELGYRVICVPEYSFIVKIASQMLGEFKHYKPILVLFSKGKPMGESELLIELLKKDGVKTASWLFDLYFDLPSSRKYRLMKKEAPFNCEYVISTDGGHAREFAELNIKHRLLRQGIHEPEAILYERDKVNDIIFVGSDIYKTRAILLENVFEWFGKRFKRFGAPDQKQIRGLELNELYASTKIVLGDSQPSPYYWSNRIYETLGRGGFLIHPYVKGLEEEFESGKHLVTYEYGNMDDLRAKLNYYLDHEDEREIIRRAGHEHVKKNYTYKNRAKKLIEIINE